MPGLIRGMARTAVVAGTATAVSNRVSRRQAERWSQEGQEYPPEAYQQPPAAPPAPGPDDTGSPWSMYSVTSRARILRWRSVSSALMASLAVVEGDC